jgi:nucleotide-binding universal stress UspA family protein
LTTAITALATTQSTIATCIQSQIPRTEAKGRSLMIAAVFSSIVVGTDGSETAGKAVAAAIDLARLAGATLELVCAYEPVPAQRLRLEAGPAPAEVQWAINQREDVDVTLAAAAEAVRAAGVQLRTYAREGDPADAILDVAEECGAGLIVVGNKGMTGAKRFLLGSVPNRVSHHAPCSVLIVRTA